MYHGVKMSIIIHPEFVKLKNRLSILIFEYHELIYHICPNIEREYLTHFGLLEYELYKKDIELSILKRKIQLIQIQINNEESIDLEVIDEILKEEFSEYERNIKKQMDELNEVMENRRRALSEEDSKRLKLLYKECVFKLHPDLNENLSDGEKELFVQITEAFKNGDLDMLESLCYLIPDGSMESISEMDRLEELIIQKELEIIEIKADYPYNKKDLLLDEEKKQEYLNELKILIKQFDEQIRKYNNRIIKLI